jgi:hypothetical protein
MTAHRISLSLFGIKQESKGQAIGGHGLSLLNTANMQL